MDGAADELESGCKEKEKKEQSLHKMWDTLLIEMEYDELFQPFDNTERKVCTCIFFQGFVIIIIRICLGKVELVFIMLNYVWREIRSSETAEFLISSQNCGSWQSMVER